METIVKINIAKMKSDIKELAEKQKYYKNQRKTDKIVGERQMPAWEASWQHQLNRIRLRLMYAAYGVAKGKCFSQIENHYSEENHPLREYQYDIDKLLRQYIVKDGE